MASNANILSGAGSPASSSPAPSSAPSTPSTSTPASTSTSTPSTSQGSYSDPMMAKVMGILESSDASSSDTEEDNGSSPLSDKADSTDPLSTTEDASTDPLTKDPNDATAAETGKPPATTKAPDGEEWDEEVGAPEVSKGEKGKQAYTWTKERGERIYQGYKTAQQYSEIAPTIEEARQHQASHVGQELLRSDFQSGDPNRVNSVLGHLNKLSPDGMVHAAGILPSGLKSDNPAAYTKLRSEMSSVMADEFYQDANRLRATDPEEADRYEFAAKTMDFISGRPQGQQSTPATPRPMAADPVDSRLAEIKAREEALKSHETTQQTAKWDSFQKSTNAEIRTQIDKAIDEALAPIAKFKDKSPVMYKNLRDGVYRDLKTSLSSDKSWTTLFQVRYADARSTQSDEDRAELSRRYVGKARTALAKLTPAAVKEFSQTFVATSDQAHDRQNRSAEKTEVSGGAARGDRSLTLPNSRYKEAKTVDEKVNALLA